MRKRRAESIIEILIAFLIIIIAISISAMASSQVNKLKRQAVVKTHIYDLAYSVAEEQLGSVKILFSTNTTTFGSTEVIVDDNDVLLTFKITIEAFTNVDFFEKSATSATLTVELKENIAEEYKVQMILFPKQEP